MLGLCCSVYNFEKENGRERRALRTHTHTHTGEGAPEAGTKRPPTTLALSLYIEICLTVQNINLTVNTLITRFESDQTRARERNKKSTVMSTYT